MSPTGIIALIPTCGRAPILRRLLDSLATSRVPVARAFVTDNLGDRETAAVVAGARIAVDFETMPLPRGPGAAQRAGWLRAQRDAGWTHALLIDDDAEVRPDTLGRLLTGLTEARAALAVPLLVDAAGHVGWYPGVADRRAWSALRRRGQTPEALLAEIGPGPFPFRWAPWGCVLVTREALTGAGAPSPEFGFEGEDIDYVLRLLGHGPGILIPEAVVRHAQVFRTEDATRAHLRRCLGVQNIANIAFRRPHGRAVLRYVPGHVWRLLRAAGWSPAALADALRALWLGACLGRPGGHPEGDRYLRALFGMEDAR